MLQRLLLSLAYLAPLASANFALIFGFPSSTCRSCLEPIYAVCAAENAYDEGQTSDFSNCICSDASLGQGAVCVTGACFDIADTVPVTMYLGWCFENNRAARADACATTGVARDVFEQTFGEYFIQGCNGDGVGGDSDRPSDDAGEDDSGQGSDQGSGDDTGAPGGSDRPSGDAGDEEGSGQGSGDDTGTPRGSDRPSGDGDDNSGALDETSGDDDSDSETDSETDSDRVPSGGDSGSTGPLGKTIVPGLVWAGLAVALGI